MKIILLDMNYRMCNEWNKCFKDFDDVLVVNSTLGDYLKDNDVDCIVSPANSYGIMDGGYDKAITDIFGYSLAKKVQEYIINNYCCEQPVGSSFIIDIPNSDKKLIHTPTMKIPGPIVDSELVYTCMRSTLICALNNNVKTIVIPAFGASTGFLACDVVAKQMYYAYKQIKTQKQVHSWKDVY